MLFYKTIEPSTLDLLKKIQSESFFRECRLVGGTSLAMQLGHRKSIDLDFFGKFEPDSFQIKEILKKIGPIQIIQESKFIFQYIANGVKIDFVNYPYEWISEKINEDNLVLASPKDIAAMKLAAITNRGTKKDFIDLFELLGYFPLSEMFDFYKEKYPDGIPFMTLKSLTWFEDAEEDPMPTMFRDYSWQTVKNRFFAEVRKLG